MSVDFGAFPRDHFQTILADPAWQFTTYGGKGVTPHRTKEDHYETMPLADMKTLPIGDLAAKDCALFMWVIDSHLDQAIELARAWGFEFKTRAFTWRKLTKDGTRARMGMGYWTRKQTEMCWLFTRGKPKRLSKGVPEIIDAPRRRHSEKPDEQYAAIESLVPGPYLELFARKTWPGWQAWGDQVGLLDSLPPTSSDSDKSRAEPVALSPDISELLGGDPVLDLVS